LCIQLDGTRYGNMFLVLGENPTHEVERVRTDGKADELGLSPEAVRAIVASAIAMRRTMNDGRKEADKRGSRRRRPPDTITSHRVRLYKP
jgi:hypothetical protein